MQKMTKQEVIAHEKEVRLFAAASRGFEAVQSEHGVEQVRCCRCGAMYQWNAGRQQILHWKQHPGSEHQEVILGL